jgi:toxin-antitoxin system PIN domain toxin
VSSSVDANILVYASNASDPAHEQSRSLIERLAAGPDLVYLFWPTIMGYLRIVTHPGILPHPLPVGEATRSVGELLRRPHVRSPGEGDGFWDIYAATAATNDRGNAIPDAHLAALMRQYGVRILYTRDRSFRRFDHIDVIDPISVSKPVP